MERGGEKYLPAAAAAAAAVTPAGRGWGSATADASTDSPPCHEGVHARTRPPSVHKIFFAHHCPRIHTLPRRLWPSHALASTPIAALPCTRFHARHSAVAALAFICFHAHSGPPIHKLARPSLSLLKLVFTRITALAYTRFHAHCAIPIHSFSRSLRSSHTLASHHYP